MLQTKHKVIFSVTFPSTERGDFSQTLEIGVRPRILWKIN